MAVVGMALLAGLSAYLFLQSRKAPMVAQADAANPPVTVSAQPQSLPPPDAAFSAAPPASAEVVAKSETIEIKVKAIPSHAEIFLDGARLPSNPFTGKFPADGAGHKLHAEAE